MKLKTQNQIVLVLTVFIVAVLGIWFFPLNKGRVQVMTGVNDFQLTVGTQQQNCEVDGCEVVLTSGSYPVAVTKEGYQVAQGTAVIRRSKLQVLELPLARVFDLRPSGFVPPANVGGQALPLPAAIGSDAVAPTWDDEGSRLIYWDPADERVKVWDGSQVRIVTVLSDVSEDLSFEWGSGGQRALARSNGELFMLDTMKASRKKLSLDFEPLNPMWHPTLAELYLNNDGSDVFVMDLSTGEVRPLGVRIDLAKTAWHEGRLLGYNNSDGAPGVGIYEYDPVSGLSETLHLKSGLTVDRVFYEGGEKAYFYSPDQQGWYEFEL